MITHKSRTKAMLAAMTRTQQAPKPAVEPKKSSVGVRKVGGIWFARVGPVRLSFCMSRKG